MLTTGSTFSYMVPEIHIFNFQFVFHNFFSKNKQTKRKQMKKRNEERKKENFTTKENEVYSLANKFLKCLP